MNVSGSLLFLRPRVPARALLGLACLAAAAASQATITELALVPHDPASHFGADLAAAGDVDGDGHADFFMSIPFTYALGDVDSTVQLRSGADFSVLKEYIGPWPAMDCAGDVDGDGLADVILGCPKFNAQTGRALVVSTATGLVLHEVSGDHPGDRFGASVAGVGDLDGDGHADFAVAAPEALLPSVPGWPGYMKVYSGASGAELARLEGEVDWMLQFIGTVMRPAGDFNGDGVPDVLVLLTFSLLDHGSVRVYSGAWITQRTGPMVLLDLPSFLPWGGHADGAGDVDGDGFDDIVVGVPNSAFPSATPGHVLVLSGADHSTILDFEGEPTLGSVVAGAGDLNQDGVPDLLAKSTVFSSAVPGRAIVVSGADGSLLGDYDGAFQQFHWGLGVVGDVNADGHVDWAVQAPGSKVLVLSQVGLWTDLGNGLAGTLGVPRLTGSGLLLGGDVVTLQLEGALPSSPAALVVGASAVNLPFKGGVLVPEALFVFPDLLCDALGGLTVTGALPADSPPSSVWFQVWQPDAGGPRGWAASNGLRAQVP